MEISINRRIQLVGRGARDYVQLPMANDLINLAYVIKPPKTQKDKVR